MRNDTNMNRFLNNSILFIMCLFVTACSDDKNVLVRYFF